VNFVIKHDEEHASLLNLIQVNWTAVVRHFEKTGDLPPVMELSKRLSRVKGDKPRSTPRTGAPHAEKRR
jgi:hypothetical protein